MSRRFDNNSNIALLPPQNQPQQIVVNGGPLMNDVQLVAMVAAKLVPFSGGNGMECAADAVRFATMVVAQAILNQANLSKMVQELAAAQPKLEG